MATSGIVNNAPMYSLDSSLRDLLNDDLFNDGDELVKSRHGERSELFQDCLNLFIKREIKDCLEEMFRAGFVNITAFKSNPMILDLFVSACDIVPNFIDLGLTLKGEILDSFTLGNLRCNEIQEIMLKDLNKLLVINKFFRCCIKVIQFNDSKQEEREGRILELESIISNFIFLYTTKMRTTMDAFGLQELIEIFIFQVKVKLEHKKLSTNLYWALCKSLPNLSQTLKSLHSPKGISIEEAILNSIGNRVQKEKAKSKGKPRSVKPKIHQFREPLLHNFSDDYSKTDDTLNQRNSTDVSHRNNESISHKTKNDISLLAGSFWPTIKYHFTKKLMNKNGLLFVGLLLLVCVKKYRSLMAIFRHVPSAFRTVYPHVVGLLKLLASI